MKKIGNILLDILIVIVVIISLATSAMVISSKATGVPNLMGYSPISVLSDSMFPTFNTGDLIIINKCDPENLENGDIITYKEVINNQQVFNTHRIIDQYEEDGSGFKLYVTQGDNVPQRDIMPIYTDQIVGKYTGTTIPVMGKVVDFLKTQNGILVTFVIPLALLFIWQLYKFIMLLAENKKDKAIEAVTSTLEDEKEKAIEEYKAQQEAAKKAQAAAALTAADIELEKQKAIEEYKAQQEAAKKAEAAATLSAADIEREKQKAVEEYIAQQKAAEDATVGNDPRVVPEQTEEPAESAESAESAEPTEPAEPATVGNDPCVVPEQTEEPTEPAEPATVGNDPCVVPEQTEEPTESAEPATVGNDPRVVPENVEEAPVAEADSSVPVKEAAREADEVKEQESSDCRDEHCSHEPHEDDENTNENTGEDTNN